jgi:hypothetical protein
LKFKWLFLLFNVVFTVFLLIILFMPLTIFGDRQFRLSLWPLTAILAVTLIILDIFYLINLRLFRLLEREDWPALSAYLEDRVVRRGRYSGRLTRLYANTCLALSDSRAVLDLENKLALVKPALVERHALLFGAAHILAGDYGGARRFFAARDRAFGVPGRPSRGFGGMSGPGGLRCPGGFRCLGSISCRSPQWLAWYHGFSLLLDKRFSEAAEKFRLLALEARDPLAAALAAWFLADKLSGLGGGALAEAANAARERVRAVLKTRRAWDRELAKTETEIFIAILRKYLNDTGNWLYPAPAASPLPPPRLEKLRKPG